MITIDKYKLKQILSTMLKIPLDDVINPSLCIPIGKHVKLYSDAIERGALKGMHLLYCRSYDKIGNGWVYELDNAEALFIKPEFFKEILAEYALKDKSYFTGLIPVDISHLLGLPENIIVGSEPSAVEPEPEIVKIDVQENIVIDIEFDPDMDRDANKVTKREYIAVLLRVPHSGNRWVDEMINYSLKLNNK